MRPAPNINQAVQQRCLKNIRKSISEADLTRILIAIEDCCEEMVLLDEVLIALHDAGLKQP